jgi:hypothetical protein
MKKLVVGVSWFIFLGSITVTILAHTLGFFAEVGYVSVLSECALIFAGFLAVVYLRTPKDVVEAVVAETEINKQE